MEAAEIKAKTAEPANANASPSQEEPQAVEVSAAQEEVAVF